MKSRKAEAAAKETRSRRMRTDPYRLTQEGIHDPEDYIVRMEYMEAMQLGATMQGKGPDEIYLNCQIENKTYLGLCDLGADVNVMPLEVAQNLRTSHMRPTHLGLAMLDGSPCDTHGILSNVLIHIGGKRLAYDFVVTDIRQP